MFVYKRKSSRQTRRQHKPWWIRNWSYKRTGCRKNRCILNDLRIEGRQEFKRAVGMPEVQILTCATFTDLVQPPLPHWVCGFWDCLSSHPDALRQVHSLFQTEFFRECELSQGFLLQVSVPARFLNSPSMCLPLLPRFIFLSIFPPTTWFRRQFLCNMCPVLTFFLHIIFLSSLSQCNMSSFFRDRSNWSPSLF